MKALQDLDIFVRTADSGSLSAAARALDLTPAAASAALKRLEAELGVPLFVRSTRTMRLTQQGELLLAQGRPALEALQQVGQQLATGVQEFRGALKLSATSDFGRNLLLPWLDAFQALHPQVEIRLHLSDRLANIYSEPVDVAFRYGKPPDSNLVALPVAPDNCRVLCVAPSYLAQHGIPETPQALSEHNCLCYMFGDEVHDRWRFSRDGAEPVTVRVRPFNVSNDGDVVRRWALLGKGIAYKAYFDVAEDLAEGRLRALCADWGTEASPLYMVVPGRRQLTPLLRALRDFVAERTAALAALQPSR
ncbi:LysR family transcriptional regulator [Cupriavidus necator]|uniref:LysR family transcriptional regulator n=1 Tax=Cupriavidus necator TaxID=106590 RepID=UPI0005B3D0F5|nr:LysR family transcriptional regulator [Cupriavidus necator]